jgi:iron-sulfur cluster repair protein YtfE (RIC family)
MLVDTGGFEMGKTAALIHETVGEVVASHPHTLDIFSRYGVDPQRYGGVPLAVAARLQSVDTGQFLAQLVRATRLVR